VILETTLRTTLHGLTAEDAGALERTAQIFQVARRTAYQLLKDGMTADGADRTLRERFGMDARFARDAVLEAQAIGKALRELMPDYLADTTAKLLKVERRLQRSRQKGAPADKIAYLEHRVAKLAAKRDEWQGHLEAGTLPPVIFGSAEAFHARRRGEITHAEWQAGRRDQFWSRGAESDDGNQHGRISPVDETFRIALATLPAVRGRLRYLSGTLWVPEGYRDLLRMSLAESYSVRVLRDGTGGWEVHVTVREHMAGEIVEQAAPADTVGGLDCNTDRLAAAVASPQGNLLAHQVVWMQRLPDARGNQAMHIISNALDEALDFLTHSGVGCLVVENLKFAQDHDTQHAFNRSTTRFRSTMVKLAIRKALRLGLKVVLVNPAYSSVIGKHKYAAAYGLSGHEAAAWVLARRGQRREERLPDRIVKQLPKLEARLMTLALACPPKDSQRRLYQKWANQLAHWKEQHSWSLWPVWEQASGLLT
jgi:IS605 OrfB family transposase